MKQGIYLDNSTMTRPSDRAVSAMISFLTDQWGSLSSPHQNGHPFFPEVTQAYRAVYDLLGASDNDTIVITSSGTEAINHVVYAVYEDITKSTGRNHFITSLIDEAPAIMSIGRLERNGCIGKMINPSSQGRVTAKEIADHISPRTALVSLSWANGLTGVVNPVAEIAELCRERGILLHVDATHVLGRLFFTLEDCGADFITFDGSHLHAPLGTGGLYIKNGRRIPSFIVGGLDQGGYRAGSVNVPALAALGIAAREAEENRDLICTEVARLRNKLETGILKRVPEAIPLFKDQERLPHVTALAFPGIANEAMLFALSRKGLYANIGGGNFQQISLVLTASGISKFLSNTALSFSLSRETNDDEIERAIEIIGDVAKRLRTFSRDLKIWD